MICKDGALTTYLRSMMTQDWTIDPLAREDGYPKGNHEQP